MTPSLPPLLVLTDRRQASAAGHTLTGVVGRAVEAGMRAVILREKDLPVAERAVLAGELGRRVAVSAGGTLLIASDASLARKIGATGVHLATRDPPVPRSSALLVGRSCHDPQELDRAAAEGCAYATVSPVFETSSKPGYGPPIGLDGLHELCERAPIPVYALGGIGPGRAGPCLQAGAAGVAVMGAVMGAADPGAVVRSLLEETTQTEEVS
ncbi:MAG TPA: thiamine phosphate synthase [Acidimicrobiales bacterium]|nr:thiamine phosphate synthase [Acidimicrobiales bacterium]